LAVVFLTSPQLKTLRLNYFLLLLKEKGPLVGPFAGTGSDTLFPPNVGFCSGDVNTEGTPIPLLGRFEVVKLLVVNTFW
jgi:hypothetical protein